jgi:hypothetical protein
MSDDGEWFAPKRYGLGAGAPIAWQGWAVLGVYIAALAAAAALLVRHHHGLFIAILVISTVAFTVVTAQHTKGGWQWRWGSEDDK